MGTNVAEIDKKKNKRKPTLVKIGRLISFTFSSNKSADIKKAHKALFSIMLSLKKIYFLERAPKRLLNLSTRPPVSAAFCLPVKNG